MAHHVLTDLALIAHLYYPCLAMDRSILILDWVAAVVVAAAALEEEGLGPSVLLEPWLVPAG